MIECRDSKMSYSISLPVTFFFFFLILLHYCHYEYLLPIEAFQIINTIPSFTHRGNYKTKIRPAAVSSVPRRLPPIPSLSFSRWVILASKSFDDDSEVDEDTSSTASTTSIQELYQIAKEQDEEWYNEFVRNVLGEEEIDQLVVVVSNATVSSSNDNKNNDCSNQSNATVSSKVGGQQEDQSVEDVGLGAGVGKKDDTKQQQQQQQQRQQQGEEIIQSMDAKEEEKEDIIASETNQGGDNQEEEEEEEEDDDDDDKSNPHNNLNPDENRSSPQPSQAESQPTQRPPTTKDQDMIVQYTDMYQTIQRVPMSILSKLGYNDIKEVSLLQAAVLELILEDEIPMPRGGIPSRWMVEEDQDGIYNREVKILQKRQPQMVNELREKEGNSASTKRRASSSSSSSSTRRRPQERRTTRSSRDDLRRSKQQQQRQRQRRPREQQSINNRPSSSSSSSTLWMDVPTFKQYLRREADLRLMILGEDWEDWVKGESEWRLNLYKKWMDVVENGIGKDVMEDLYTVPPSERRPSRERKEEEEEDAAWTRKRVVDRRVSPRERRARNSNVGASGRTSNTRSMSRQRPSFMGRNVDASTTTTTTTAAAAPTTTRRRRTRTPRQPDQDKDEQDDDYRRDAILHDTRRVARMTQRPKEESFDEPNAKEEQTWDTSSEEEYYFDDDLSRSRRRRRNTNTNYRDNRDTPE